MNPTMDGLRTAPRRVLVAGVAGLAAAACLAGGHGARGTTSGGVELLPDLLQERPQDLSVQRVRGRQLLGFRSAVQNVGDGPLIIVGSRASRATRDMQASQLVLQAGGALRRVSGAGFLRYVPSPDHSHWHFLPFERYELRSVATGARIVRDRKSGFCLGDRYRVEPRRPNAVAAPVYASRCGLNRPALLKIREGISVGWADDYAAYLDSQHIDVTDVPAGRYLLVHTVNPTGRIVERSRANNQASVRIALTRSAGRVRVRILP
jgi:Lysyl oxidase